MELLPGGATYGGAERIEVLLAWWREPTGPAIWTHQTYCGIRMYGACNMSPVAERDVFVVLADPTRRRLVEVMSDGERSVSELVAHVDIDQPGVSRHLRMRRYAHEEVHRIERLASFVQDSNEREEPQ